MIEPVPSDLQKQAEEIARLRQELVGARMELDYANLVRNGMGQALKMSWRSGTWRSSIILRWLWSLLRRPRVGISQLIALGDVNPTADGGWEGTGLPMLLVPIFPRKGWIRVRARMWSSISSRAHLYMDTGNSFGADEFCDLGPVHGQTLIDRFVFLPATTHLLRFDPIRQRGRISISEFSIEPISALAHFREAFLSNIRRAVAPGEAKPSVLIGLKLLLTGRWGLFFRQLHANAAERKEIPVHTADYEVWCQQHEVSDAERRRMQQEIAKFRNPPRISVILPVYNTDEQFLRQCIQSVCNQIYPHWELCIADDASPAPHVRRVLDEYAGRDPRIKIAYRSTNGNISATSNAALKLATGEYIALLDHDDKLSEHALFRVAQEIMRDPSVDMLYSDEDKLALTGERVEPFFKPDWSPEFFLACMYTCHLGVYRTDLVRQIGGWRSEFDGAQDYDLVLRLIARGIKIQHIPDVLYHWRIHQESTASSSEAKPKAHEVGRRAIEEHLASLGRPAEIKQGPAPTFHAVRYQISNPRRISIIIPSACKKVPTETGPAWLSLRCVESIRRLSTYPDIEILVLDRCGMPAELQSRLEELGARRVSYDFEFNWSRVNNYGAAAATGEILLFLNDDMEVITPDWLEWMAGYAQWPEIGAVGAMLVFPDDTLQHTGVILPGGNPTHPFYKFPRNHPGQFWSNQIHRNWSAVTGACLMTRADLFRKIGGFDERFPLNFNDVEYGLRLIERGLRVVYTPEAKLYHFESTTRKAEVRKEEIIAIHEAWTKGFRWDPYYNPHLALGTSDYRINPESPLEPEPARITCNIVQTSTVGKIPQESNWAQPIRLAQA